MAGPLISVMGVMAPIERENTEVEISFMEKTRRRFMAEWRAAPPVVSQTQAMKDFLLKFWLQVEGLIMAGFLPPNDNRGYFAHNGKAKGLFEALSEYPPIVQLENGVWGVRFLYVAIPCLTPDGNYLFSSWRRLDEEAMVMLDQLRELHTFIKTVGSGDPYWTDMISFSAMVTDEFRRTTMVFDVYGYQTFVKKFTIPAGILMEVLNCSWVHQADGDRVKFKFNFLPIPCTVDNDGEDENQLQKDLFVHSVLVWNARRALRCHFWEAYNYLHRRTLPDVMLIFNTGVSENRLIGVGNDQIKYDQVFTAPAIDRVGGMMCQWNPCRVKVACLTSTTEKGTFVSISITPRRYMGLAV